MNPYSVHAASLAALQTEMGAECPSFIWNGQNWKALPGGAKRRKDNGPGGFSLDSDLSITCLMDQFAGTAAAQREAMINTDLTYLGEPYSIQDVTIAPGGRQLRLECSDAAQGL